MKKQPVNESENERILQQMERQIEQHPLLSPEEELQLAHMVARGEAEKRRAESLKETPNKLLIEEGQRAYFRLIYASQSLILSVAKEYLEPGRDLREIINAANVGLTFAITEFGMKTHMPFRSYASHWLHLEIIEALDE